MTSSLDKLDPRKAWADERRERVVSALSELVAPLLTESPHLRVSAASVIDRIHVETGVARALILGDIQSASELNIPIAENVAINHGVDDGKPFLSAHLIENPVQDLES